MNFLVNESMPDCHCGVVAMSSVFGSACWWLPGSQVQSQRNTGSVYAQLFAGQTSVTSGRARMFIHQLASSITLAASTEVQDNLRAK